MDLIVVAVRSLPFVSMAGAVSDVGEAFSGVVTTVVEGEQDWEVGGGVAGKADEEELRIPGGGILAVRMGI